MGTTAFMSVPYSLYSNSSANNNIASGNLNQTLYHNGTEWIATSNLMNNGDTVTTNSDMLINEITVGKGSGDSIFSSTALGNKALYSNTTGDWNTATGNKALLSNTTGNANTATGNKALLSNTTGDWNTATGNTALLLNTTGYANTATGDRALYSNTTGNWNTAIGDSALFSNTTGTVSYTHLTLPTNREV